jgi:hypothetical protein
MTDATLCDPTDVVSEGSRGIGEEPRESPVPQARGLVDFRLETFETPSTVTVVNVMIVVAIVE